MYSLEFVHSSNPSYLFDYVVPDPWHTAPSSYIERIHTESNFLVTRVQTPGIE